MSHSGPQVCISFAYTAWTMFSRIKEIISYSLQLQTPGLQWTILASEVIFNFSWDTSTHSPDNISPWYTHWGMQIQVASDCNRPPPDQTIKNLKHQQGKRSKEAETWEGCSEWELIEWCFFMQKNVSSCGITWPRGRLEGRLVVFKHPLEWSQSVLTQKEKQSSVGDVTGHPEESSKHKLPTAWIQSTQNYLGINSFCSQKLDSYGRTSSHHKDSMLEIVCVHARAKCVGV